MTHFSLSVHWAKNLSHFDLKIWVKFLFCQWLNFLGQNDSFFSGARSEKIETFWPKNLGQILVPLMIQFFLGQNDWFFLSMHEAKKFSYFDLKIWVKYLFH